MDTENAKERPESLSILSYGLAFSSEDSLTVGLLRKLLADPHFRAEFCCALARATGDVLRQACRPLGAIADDFDDLSCSLVDEARLDRAVQMVAELVNCSLPAVAEMDPGNVELWQGVANALLSEVHSIIGGA